MYVFRKLQEKLKQFDLNLTVTEEIKNLKRGKEVVVGGKITNLYSDFFCPGNKYMTIDDDIGDTNVYFVGPVYKEFQDILTEGNIVLVKGRIADGKVGKGKGIRFIACESVELVDSG